MGTSQTDLFATTDTIRIKNNGIGHDGDVASGKEVWESSTITGVADADQISSDKGLFMNTPDNRAEDSDSRLSEAQLLQGTEKTQHSQKVEVSGRRRRRRRRQQSHSFFKQPAPPPGHTKPPCGPNSPGVSPGDTCTKPCEKKCKRNGGPSGGCADCCAKKGRRGEEQSEESLLSLLEDSSTQADAATTGWNSC